MTLDPARATVADHPQVVVTVAMTLTGRDALSAADEVKDSLWSLATCLPPGTSVVNVATTVAAAVQTDQDRFVPPPAAPALPAAPEPLAPAPLKMFPAARIATLDGTPVRLTRREFDLLLHLARHPGRVFTRQQLSLAVWQEDFMRGERTIDVHIHRLRRGLAGRGPEITTVRGVGYRLDAAHRVSVVDDQTQ